MTIETKAQPGAWIWYMRDNKAKQARIDEIRIVASFNTWLRVETDIQYSLENINDSTFNASQIFLTKEDLLQSL